MDKVADKFQSKSKLVPVYNSRDAVPFLKPFRDLRWLLRIIMQNCPLDSSNN